MNPNPNSRNSLNESFIRTSVTNGPMEQYFVSDIIMDETGDKAWDDRRKLKISVFNIDR